MCMYRAQYREHPLNEVERIAEDEELKKLIVLVITQNAPPRSPANPLYWRGVTDKLFQILKEYGYRPITEKAPVISELAKLLHRHYWGESSLYVWGNCYKPYWRKHAKKILELSDHHINADTDHKYYRREG